MKQIEPAASAPGLDDAIQDLIGLWTDVVDRLIAEWGVEEGSPRVRYLLSLLLSQFDRRLIAWAASVDGVSATGPQCQESSAHQAPADVSAPGTGPSSAQMAGDEIVEHALRRFFTAAQVRELISISCI